MEENEKAVLNLLGDAWNAFTALPSYHPDEADEFKTAIHAAQQIIMARAAVRIEPGFFTPVATLHADRDLSPETVEALAAMIDLAAKAAESGEL